MDIAYWRQGEGRQNFGDYLTELFLSDLVGLPLHPADRYHLIGSVICDYVINKDLVDLQEAVDPTIAFWGCGARGDQPLSAESLKHCVFHGVRGPLSRDALGLPASTPLGDPALLLPLIYTPRATPSVEGRSVAVAHCLDPKSLQELRSLGQVDIAVSAEIPADLEALRGMIDLIAGARFVLAGALHAAVVAAAYGRPFGFWDTGYVDVPFKWRDFAASLGLEASFVRNAIEGEEQYSDAIASMLRRPDLTPILLACPLQPRATAVLAALARDGTMEQEAAGAAIAALAEGEAGLARAVARYRANSWRRNQTPIATPATGLTAPASDRRPDEDGRPDEDDVTSTAPPLVDADGCVQRIDFRNDKWAVTFLGVGWSPSSEWGPWSIEDVAELVIPPEARWGECAGITFEGHVFAPQLPPFEGRREIVVFANSVEIDSFTFFGPPDGDNIYTQFYVPLTEVPTVATGGLCLRFLFPVNCSLGDLERMPREWRPGVNLMSMWGAARLSH